MKPSDYEFSVGDKVVTIYGDVGHVIYICKCERCFERGFNELKWVSDNYGYLEWITIHDAERGFDVFYQIGKYRFNHEFDKTALRLMIKEKEAELASLKKQMEVMEEKEAELASLKKQLEVMNELEKEGKE